MGGRRWLLAELHCHSGNSDGELAPEEVVALYENNGYDVLAITDHEILTKVNSDKMIIIPACEWNTGGISPFLGHLLIYFLKEMPTSLDDAVSQGAIICAAHPITWPWWKRIPPQVKGYEAFSYKLVRKFWIFGKMANALASLLCGKFYKIKVAGSDAHRKRDYAKIKFWIFARPNLEDIKQALLEGKVKWEYGEPGRREI